VRAKLNVWRRSILRFIQDWLEDEGSQVVADGLQLRIDDAWTVSITVVNGVGYKQEIWFNHRPVEPTDIVVFARIRLADHRFRRGSTCRVR
jgi:hypothetical protein